MTSVHPPLPPSSDRDSFQPRPSHSSNVVVFDETNNVDEDVADFFDTRLKSREDLGKIKAILQEQTTTGEELKQQVVYCAGSLSWWNQLRQEDSSNLASDFNTSSLFVR